MNKLLTSLLASTLTVGALQAAPKAIVFDFGGVMTGTPNREAVVTFICETFHFSREEFDRVNQEKRRAVQEGKSDEQFWLDYAKERNFPLPPDWNRSLKKVMQEALGVNLEMYALLEELRERQVVIALLSNIDSRLAKLVREFGLYKPFEPCLLSCEIGVEKPAPQAYERLLAELQLPPAEVIFIDDLPENVEGALKMGIDAILFQSIEQLRQELDKRL